MSKIGKIPVVLPKDVKAAVQPSAVQLEGPKGKLAFNLPAGVSVEQKDAMLIVNRKSDSKQIKANHGTARAIIANMIEGVTKGYKKTLDIQGVGFRAALKGDLLILNLGFSHPVEFPIPKAVKVSVPSQTEIHIEGLDKAIVGEVAAKIRAIKKPEPYKGKGIRYTGEYVRRKQGKSVTK